MKGKLWFSALLVGALGMPAIRAEAFVFSVCTSQVEPEPFQTTGTPVTWETPNVLVNYFFDDPVIDFNNAVLDAIAQWNNVDGSLFEYLSEAQEGDPCAGPDDQVYARFSADICGFSWGTNVIGVTGISYTACVDGSAQIIDTDILINANESWDVYNVPPVGSSALDFRRVILHELGHVAGLDHPDEAVPPEVVEAIMNSEISDKFELQTDDKNGVISIYKTTSSIGGGGGGGGGGGSADLLLLGGMFIYGWLRLRQRRTRANLSDGAS